MPKSQLVDLDYQEILIDNPEKHDAILMVVEAKEVWLPYSLVEIDRDNKEVTMPEWLAIEKELV